MSKHKQPGGIWTAQYAHCAMHYGFSYHFSGNGTYFFQINIVTSIFIENF